MTQRSATLSALWKSLILKESLACRQTKPWVARGSRLLVDGFWSPYAAQQTVRSVKCAVKSGSPPRRLVLLELVVLLLYVGRVYAHTPTRRYADTLQVCP